METVGGSYIDEDRILKMSRLKVKSTTLCAIFKCATLCDICAYITLVTYTATQSEVDGGRPKFSIGHNVMKSTSPLISPSSSAIGHPLSTSPGAARSPIGRPDLEYKRVKELESKLLV